MKPFLNKIYTLVIQQIEHHELLKGDLSSNHSLGTSLRVAKDRPVEPALPPVC